MPLSWNEIRSRAQAFSTSWTGVTSERAESQTFWNEFFAIFGVDRRRVASFEQQVRITRAGERIRDGRIDAFWKGTLLIEHKSAGQRLDRAFDQAIEYFDGLPERDLPRYILVSDFQNFRLYDMEESTDPVEFERKDLPDHIHAFAFIAGYRTQKIVPQDPVNLKAAERMGDLHDRLKESGYSGHQLEVLLVRLLFCLFAEDTGIFQPASAFRLWVEDRTSVDGSDLGPQLALLFQVLNSPEDKRSKTLDESLAAFPYVNGRLFEESIPIAAFDRRMRDALLECCALDWSTISPAIFGALFQSIMDPEARRNLGAHYTSEENILKLIKPLFLDALWDEFHRIRNNPNKLVQFHKKLRSLTFFDPACGCGNFLVIAYRELRTLELEILRATTTDNQQVLDVHQLILVDVDQFHGIEIEEFPAQIAQVALWLIDHQMNIRVSAEFGLYFVRIPLRTTPPIHFANSLRLDWNAVLPAERCNYLLGNPPFVGKQYQSDEQKADMKLLTAGIRGAGVLDFVTAWYIKAARYTKGTDIRCAFVSTNSVTQGEQVGILWPWLLTHGINIHFAHRTFQWSNEARGMAAVHCVIVGFGYDDPEKKVIFEYDDIRGEPHAVIARNINPYLVDAPTVFLIKRRTPICVHARRISFGSMPNDGGHLLFSGSGKDEFLTRQPQALPYFRRLMGSDELINGGERWCLWLIDVPPERLRAMPEVMERVDAVRRSRQSSDRDKTRELAATPTVFGELRQPAGRYLAIPEVSSENRQYIPMAFLDADVIATNKLYTMVDATLFDFGVLSSAFHMAWTRAVCGRLESRYQYSAGIVYNNFPWPDDPTDRQRAAVEAAAQDVLDARAQFPGASLADLYDPAAMPPALVKAHQRLDAAVDVTYAQRRFANDAARVAFLFELYQKLTDLFHAPLPSSKKATKKKARKKSNQG